MRLLLKAALIKDKPKLELQAAAEEEVGPVGRWFSANLDLRTVLAVLSMAAAVFGGYFTLQNNGSKLEAQINGQQRQLEEYKAAAAAVNREQDERMQRLYARFNAEVVSREEYEDSARHVSTRIDGLAAQQQALYTVMLNRALGGSR